MNYWLMKSEPDVYSIQHLKRDRTSLWEGVRNYQARNFMMKEMKPGDLVLFYHSNAEPPGVAGLARIFSEAEPDPTQFDKKSEYFDPKSTLESPRWNCVRVSFEKEFKNLVPLDKLRKEPILRKMTLLQPGTRLSITPVSEKEFEHICKLGGL